MPEFKKITFEDIEIINSYFQNQTTKNSNYSTGSKLLWGDYFNQEYLIYEDTLIVKMSLHNDTWFDFPLGKNVEKGLTFIEEYCRNQGIEIVYGTIPHEFIAKLHERYLYLSLLYKRSWSDYIYDYAELKQHKGKKYNKKRNHIHNFDRNYPNHYFEKISINNIELVKSFYRQFLYNREITDPLEVEETRRLNKLLDSIPSTALVAYGLFVDQQCVGLVIGEIVNETVLIHVEKADIEFVGAYQKLFYCFLQLFDENLIHYINREEDDGNLGLRKSKLSYYPSQLLHKYTVFIKE